MKKLFIILTGLYLVFAPQRVWAETIDEFTADIRVEKTGEVTVREEIQYNFGPVEKHGIYRKIPYIKTNSDGQKFKLTLSGFSLKDGNNQSYRFSKTDDGKSVSLKIGDPDKTVTGQQLYVISYRVAGAISYFSDHDELYWNVTGNDWLVPVNSAVVNLTLPGEIPASDIRLTCYTGSVGSTDQSCSSEPGRGSARFQTDTGLLAQSGLTIVVGFPKNAVAVVEPRPVTEFADTVVGKIILTIVGIIVFILSLVWYIALPVGIIFSWWKYGRDPVPPMGVAHAWFDVPKTKTLRPLAPGETGTLVDEQADMRDITATIVDLARRGYLKITEFAKNDFYLKQPDKLPKGDTLQPFEKQLLDGIFQDSAEVRIKDEDFSAVVSEVKKELYGAVVTEGYFDKNPQTTRTIFSVISGVALFTFNIPLAMIAFIFGRAMPRKTMAGAQVAAVALSLKNFLVSQEHQLAYQAKNQLFFEKFLPYAVAFGVEKIWAERFRDINLKPPDWYQGQAAGTFNSVYLTSALSSSLASFTQAATPTSSTSGFSSGFSGGSSGGGGGGGGGGSW